jgi:Carboxypeptidase regulatory-like domain
MKSCAVYALILSSAIWLANPGFGQSLGNAGTIEGIVVDQSGAAVPGAAVNVKNPVTGYGQSAVTASDGSFRLVNLPPNQYHLEVTAKNFSAFTQDVTIRNSLPIQIKATLPVAGASTAVTVEATGADVLELDPSAHIDTDRSQLLKIPALDPGAGLSQAIV